MIEVVIEVLESRWRNDAERCISMGRVIEIASVIMRKEIPGMRSILIMIILRRTHRKPLFIEAGWDIMLV